MGNPLLLSFSCCLLFYFSRMDSWRSLLDDPIHAVSKARLEGLLKKKCVLRGWLDGWCRGASPGWTLLQCLKSQPCVWSSARMARNNSQQAALHFTSYVFPSRGQ